MSANQEQIGQLVGLTEANRDPFIAISIRNTAAALVEDAAKVKSGQKVLIWFDAPGIELVKEMNLRCQALGAEVKFYMREYEEDAAALENLDQEGIHHMFDEESELINWADNMLIVRNPEDPEAMGRAPKDKAKMYADRYSQVHEKRFSNHVAWSLFLFPTEYEAGKEGLPYGEYFREYMEACNQPWGEIRKTQAKLIEKLNRGKTLELVANENDEDPNRRTHVTMSIDGMTFCNSTVDANYPGSEVFSAPVMNSVNGQIFAPGEYMYSSILMKDIQLIIENGKIVEAHAAENDEGLQEILSRGEGARYFGEVALGTNPGLTRRFFNDLLNEKVSGSFHMALGHCYTFKEYAGEQVNVMNGNDEKRTSNHWDLTILMHPSTGGGRVVVDGEVIQKDGKFLDPELALLNPKI